MFALIAASLLFLQFQTMLSWLRLCVICLNVSFITTEKFEAMLCNIETTSVANSYCFELREHAQKFGTIFIIYSHDLTFFASQSLEPMFHWNRLWDKLINFLMDQLSYNGLSGFQPIADSTCSSNM